MDQYFLGFGIGHEYIYFLVKQNYIIMTLKLKLYSVHETNFLFSPINFLGQISLL